jgi:hypothetical protein
VKTEEKKKRRNDDQPKKADTPSAWHPYDSAPRIHAYIRFGHAAE